MPNPNDKNVYVKLLSHTMSDVSHGNGEPMPQDVLARCNAADLSGVTVHKNNMNAAAMGAKAFALGNDIFFAPGQYNPDTNSGRELIAHELTHVVQQNGGH